MIKLFEIIAFRMADLLDIIFVSIVFYSIFLLFKGTRVVQMTAGIFLIGLVYLLALWWDLQGIQWVFSNMTAVGVVALVIVFQPEIRGGLMRLGQSAGKLDVRRLLFESPDYDQSIQEILKAVRELSRSSYGALIVIEQDVGLRSYMDTGEMLDSKVSALLLRALFFPNSPLHDGAVIIQKDRIAAAGCVLPVFTTGDTSQENLGMRHRAAKTLASETDALVIVISEETSTISLAYRNRLRRKLSLQELQEELIRHLQ
jgi:diadenylate cyclase